MSHHNGTKVWKCNYNIRDVVAGKNVLDELLRQLRHRQWPDSDVFGIHLATEEALVNAIKHGNRMDKGKFVDISIVLSAKRIWIEITDQGSGFDPRAVPDCTAPENLEIPSGRGLRLMRHFMSKIEHSDQGNRATMAKKRTEGSAPA